jgi:hypothetical protein
VQLSAHHPADQMEVDGAGWALTRSDAECEGPRIGRLPLGPTQLGGISRCFPNGYQRTTSSLASTAAANELNLTEAGSACGHN